MSFAKIENINGSPAVVIDGKPYPPMAMTTRMKKPDYLKSLGESGIKIYFIMTNTSWLRPGKTWIDENGVEQHEQSGVEKFILDAEMLLENVPDAYIIVRIGMHPPVEWMNENPDELMKFNDGTHREAILQSEVHKDVVPGMYSLHSEKWRRDGDKALNDFCDEVEKLPFADHIIGYFLAAGGTSEWYPVNPLSDWANNIYGDCSEPFRAEFEKYLRNKYKTTKELRAAWRIDDATFENPIIPNLAEREFTNVETKIIDAMQNYESAERIIGKHIEMNPKELTNIGVFLNVDHYQYVQDFYSAFHEGTANTIIHFAQTIRKRGEGKLIGAFYGSYGCTNFFDSGTAEGVLPILDSGALDFLAAPGVYNNREPGGYVGQREMQDSFRLRNQIYVVEEDSRTHLEDSFYRDAMGLYTIKDSINTLKRDFARNICEDIFAWWFDQHEESGRYKDDEIYKLFKRQEQIAELAYSFDRKKKNEIALIFDQESVHCVSQYTSCLMLDYYRSSDLARIGAPVDYYFHNDMARGDMPDYKLYVMMNTFMLTDKEREVIINKAKKNQAVVLWLYAPGFINPNEQKRIDVKNIENLVGMKVKMIEKTMSPRFKIIEEDHPALKYGDKDRRYGYIDRDVHSNVWLGSVIGPPYVTPAFYIDDENAEVLGNYCEWNKPAYAVKKQDGWISAYCAPQILRSELIASLAEYAGCHIYSKDDDCIYANESFITVHAKESGSHTIYFKSACSPYEVYEEKYYGFNIEKLTIEMRKGETKMFCIHPYDFS